MKSNKDIIKQMVDDGRLDYGAEIHRHDFMQIFGIEPLVDSDIDGLPLVAIEKLLGRQDLARLGASDAVRDYLLPMGRYFREDKDYYRVDLPSENKRRASLYIEAGNRKISRAANLLLGTPTEPTEQDNAISRASVATARAKKLLGRI